MTTPLPSWRYLLAAAPARVSVLLGLELLLLALLYLRPLTVGWLVDGVLGAAPGAGITTAVSAMALGCCWLCRHMAGGGKDAALAAASSVLTDRARHSVVRRLQELPLGRLDGHGAGLLAERLERDLALLEASALRTPIDLLMTAVRILLGALLIAWMCPSLLASLVVIAPLLLVALLVVRATSQLTVRARAAATARVGAASREALAATACIAQAGAGEEVIARLAVQQRALARMQVRLALLTGWLPPLVLVLLHAGLGTVLVVGGSAVANGTMSYGGLTTCLFLVFLVLGPLQELVLLCDQQHSIACARQRLDDFLRADESAATTEVGSIPTANAALSWRDLCFSYGDAAPVLAHRFDEIVPGERLLIRGSSGSGKSTLVQVLSGLRAPTTGKVLLGACDLHQLPSSHLRGCLATVMQGDRLFAGTIRDNLRLALPAELEATAADQSIHSAVRRLGCEVVIDALSDGYQTEVVDGDDTLSLAQRQQLLLVRAVLAAPSLLILDEATSALDGLTARRIYQAIAGMVQTLVVVDHRPAMVDIADRVMVLERCAVPDGLRTPPPWPWPLPRL